MDLRYCQCGSRIPVSAYDTVQSQTEQRVATNGDSKNGVLPSDTDMVSTLDHEAWPGGSFGDIYADHSWLPPASAINIQSNGFSATELSAKLDTLQWSLQEVHAQLEAGRDDAAVEAQRRAQKAAQDQVEYNLRAECAALWLALATIIEIGRNALLHQ